MNQINNKTNDNLVQYYSGTLLELVYQYIDNVQTRKNFRKAFENINLYLPITYRDKLQKSIESQYEKVISRIVKHPGSLIINFPFKVLYAIIVIPTNNIVTNNSRELKSIAYLQYAQYISLESDRYLLCYHSAYNL
jgi:hypothetical protein